MVSSFVTSILPLESLLSPCFALQPHPSGLGTLYAHVARHVVQRDEDTAPMHRVSTVKEPTMEEYRIQPVTTEEQTYDGVYIDSLGAWLGKVVTADNMSGQRATIVELAMNTAGGRVPAPAHWRDLVIEQLPP